jgi:putative membrane protein
MKKTVKRLAAAAMAAALVFPMLFTGSAMSQTSIAAEAAPDRAADTREEVVYATLSPDGGTKEVNVVTILHNAEAGTIADYGDFAAVKNLTDTGAITQAGGTVTVSAPKGDLYYQGTMKNAELPWKLDVTYYLDGAELPAAELAGKSGHVRISIATSKNPAAEPSYFDNYMLQISLTLDSSKCTGITAPGGTVASAGVDKLVTFAAMPGAAGGFDVETDASAFSMEGIQFSAVPLSMKIDPPDTGALKSDLAKLTDAVSQLNDGIGQLEGGALDLKKGAGTLKDGSAAFAGGLNQLTGSAAGLMGGSAQIKEALNKIVSSLNGTGNGSADGGGLNLADLQQLPDGLKQLAAGLDGVSSGLSDLKSGFAQSYGALKDAILKIPDATVSEAELGALYQASPDKKDTIDTLAAYYAAGVQTKATFAAVRPAFDNLDGALSKSIDALGTISSSLSSTAAQLSDALRSSDTASQLAQLSSGLQALSDNYGQFHEGLVAFAAGVSDLNKNYGALNGGLAGLSDGVVSLYDGLGKAVDGTSELNDGVSGLPDKTDQEIAKLLDGYDKSGLKPVSFTSSKNTGTVSVQFVLKTEKIEAPAAPAPVPEPAKPETVWDKFIDLFR